MRRFLLLLVLGLTMTLSAQETPVPANTNGWLHYDGDESPNGYGIFNKWAIVLPAHSFAGKLTKVKIYTRESNYYPGTLTMTIVEGGDTPDQGTQRHSQEVPLQSEKGWKEMILSTPLIFDEDNNVWIVFDCPGDLESGIAASCLSPAEGVSGTGSYRYHENSQSWIVYSGGHHHIRAYFQTWEFPENTIYSWDFENGIEGWNGVEDNTKWLWGTGDKFESRGSHSGTHTFKRLSNEGDAGVRVDMLVSPELDLSNYTDVKLGFWRLQRPWTGNLDTLTIYYRPSEFANWMPLVTYKDYVEKWTLEEGIELPYLSPTYQIGFEYRDGYGFGIGLDDIYITGTRLPDPDDSEPDGEKLTVHEGGNVCGYIPYATFYLDSYTRSQYLFSNEDLAAMRDMSVNAIRWYSSNELDEFPDYGEARFDIYLKEVDYTALTAFETKGNDDIIYQGAIVPVRTSGNEILVTIVFDKPFVYHGGNLLIGCDNTVKGTDFATRFWGFSYYPDEIAIYGYSNVSLEDVYIRQAYFLPKTTFYYTEPTTGIESIVESRESKVESRKILHDGNLYILRDGKIFNAQGAQIR